MAIYVKLLLTISVVLLASACSSLPEQQTILVDEYDVAYAVSGEGAPVVVFESAIGATMDNWLQVFPEVAKESRVFAYNRRGNKGSQHHVEGSSKYDELTSTLGHLALGVVVPGLPDAIDIAGMAGSTGEPPPEPRTAAEVIDELRGLLAAAEMEPPYVLVGHSVGGLYMLYFAKTYPGEVAGLVLVDSSHPELHQRCREGYGDEQCELSSLQNFLLDRLPREVVGEYHGIEETENEVSAAGSLRTMPLVIISHGKPGDVSSDPVAGMWPELQQDLADQLPNGVHLTAQESGHFIQKEQPQIVIDAINDVISQVRNQ